MLRSALILTCAKAAHAPVCASARMCAVGCAQAARSSTLADTLVLSNLVVVSSHLIYSTTHTHIYSLFSNSVVHFLSWGRCQLCAGNFRVLLKFHLFHRLLGVAPTLEFPQHKQIVRPPLDRASRSLFEPVYLGVSYVFCMSNKAVLNHKRFFIYVSMHCCFLSLHMPLP